MCYSAAVRADHRRYLREFGVQISLQDFYDLYHRRLTEPNLVIPDEFGDAILKEDPSPDQSLSGLILLGREQREAALRDEIAEQSLRRDSAQRKLAVKATKAAQESLRIAAKKIETAEAKLTEMRLREPRGTDARIYPGQYAPVIVM